jgi:hypothetical protein
VIINTPEIIINVKNNVSDKVEVEQSQSTNSQGTRQIDIIIDEMVAKNLNNTGSVSNQAVRNLGGRIPLISRG